MVKWKKMNKKMAGIMLGVMMLFTASTTAFAYVDESAEASKTEVTQTEQTVSQEEAQTEEAAGTDEVLPENTDSTSTGTAFSSPGNGEVKDDITDSSSKEFLTVTTKNNNTFYIVIDRSATSQNVYMLSQIDIYLETEVEVECQGECFKAKGKSVLQDGWKIYENCFKNPDRLAIPDPAQEMKEQMPKVAEGQKFYAVTAEKTEHYTSPPKPYSDVIFCDRKEWIGIEERSSA